MPTILKLAVIVSGHLFLIMGRPFKVDKNAIGYTSMYARWRCSFCATRSTFKLMDIFRRIIQWWIYMWYFVRKNFYCPVWKEKRTLYVPIIISYRVNSKYPRWFWNEHTYLGFSIYIRKYPLSGDGNVLLKYGNKSNEIVRSFYISRSWKSDNLLPSILPPITIKIFFPPITIKIFFHPIIIKIS